MPPKPSKGSASDPVAAPTQEPPSVKDQQTQLFVTKTFGKTAAPEGDPEVIAVHRFMTDPARVEVGMGLTLNLGNYESARVDVRISVPVYREEINDAYEYARKYVSKRVEAEVDEIRASAAAASKKSGNPF